MIIERGVEEILSVLRTYPDVISFSKTGRRVVLMDFWYKIEAMQCALLEIVAL